MDLLVCGMEFESRGVGRCPHFKFLIASHGGPILQVCIDDVSMGERLVTPRGMSLSTPDAKIHWFVGWLPSVEFVSPLTKLRVFLQEGVNW